MWEPWDREADRPGWEPEPPAEPEPWRPGRANLILAGLIALAGVALFAVTVRSGRADSALLFVGLPMALAAALALLPGRTTHGRVFGATTIGLLLAAVALREGAVCLVLAAPLVYLLAHTTTGFVQLLRRPRGRLGLLVLPLLLVSALEGSGESLRVHPVQSVEVVRVVALPADEVGDRIAAGPRPVSARSLPLRLLGAPVPVEVAGTGMSPGDRWQFGFHGTSHGPGGDVTAEVSTATADSLAFTVVSDSAITARWFTWQEADISWRAVDEHHTEVRVSATVVRGLDPSWYFGPWQDFLLRHGMGHLLDMMELR